MENKGTDQNQPFVHATPLFGLYLPYLTRAVSSAGAAMYPANGTAAAGAIHSGGGEMSLIIQR